MPQPPSPPKRASRRDPKINAIFGDVLRLVRTERNMTQEQLAIDCGMDRAYISELERGLKEPCLATILKIAATLGVPVADIMAQVESRTRM